MLAAQGRTTPRPREHAQETPYSNWDTAWAPIEAEQEYAEPLNARRSCAEDEFHRCPSTA